MDATKLHYAFAQTHQAKDTLKRAARALDVLGDERAVLLTAIADKLRAVAAELEAELNEAGVQTRRPASAPTPQCKPRP